jgi:phage-related protein
VCVFENEFYTLHGFIKKTQKTPEADFDLARRRKWIMPPRKP